MKRWLLIVSMSLAAGCAGIAPRPQADVDPGGHWAGYLLHDGLRAPILVNLDEGGRGWTGTYSEGDNAVQLMAVKVDEVGRVHFELQGNVSFDGAVAGNSMAGTVTGPAAGSFALNRASDPAWKPEWLVTP
jgi:hypothetical protein